MAPFAAVLSALLFPLPPLARVLPVLRTCGYFLASIPLFPLRKASGEFPRPAASLGLLSRLLAENLRNPTEDYSGPSQKALARFGSGLPRSWSPQENGAQKEN